MDLKWRRHGAEHSNYFVEYPAKNEIGRQYYDQVILNRKKKQNQKNSADAAYPHHEIILQASYESTPPISKSPRPVILSPITFSHSTSTKISASMNQEKLDSQSNNNSNSQNMTSIEQRYALLKTSQSERDKTILQQPPKQLDVLLPWKIPSKKEYLSLIKGYSDKKKELHDIKQQLIEERKAKEILMQKLNKDKMKKKQQEELIRKSLSRISNRIISQCFNTWYHWIKQKAGVRRMVGRLLKNQRRDIFNAWIEYIKICHMEYEISATVIQCAVRRYFAKLRVFKMKTIIRSATIICNFGRRIIAGNILQLCKMDIRRREELIKQSLLRLDCNKVLLVFTKWRRYTRIVLTARKMNLKGKVATLRVFFDNLTRYTVKSKRQRKFAAGNTLRRVGRGFLGRLKARDCKLRRHSAITIQNWYRIFISKKKLRQKLHQRRMLNRKIKSALGNKFKAVFLRWKSYTKTMMAVKALMYGNKKKRLQQLFDHWLCRVEAAVEIQRVMRGGYGRRLVKKLKQERLEALVKQTIKGRKNKKKSTLEAHRAIIEMQISQMSKDQELQSPLLTELCKRQMDVVNWKAKFYDYDAEGVIQRFEIQHNRRLILQMLQNRIDSELSRLKNLKQENEMKRQEENVEWKRMIKEFVGSKADERLDDYLRHKYYGMGKSFNINISKLEDVYKLLREWKHKYDVGLLSNWLLVSWIVEALLFKSGVKGVFRTKVWSAIVSVFELDTLEDIAVVIKYRVKESEKHLNARIVRKQTTKKSPKSPNRMISKKISKISTDELDVNNNIYHPSQISSKNSVKGFSPISPKKTISKQFVIH